MPEHVSKYTPAWPLPASGGYLRTPHRSAAPATWLLGYFENSTGTPGGGSHKAGVRAGDVLLSVNETPVINWPLDVVAAKLEGETGTWVRLTLQRPAPLGGKT
jgi:C-terminal processing protease CtpA/Prc